MYYTHALVAPTDTTQTSTEEHSNFAPKQGALSHASSLAQRALGVLSQRALGAMAATEEGNLMRTRATCDARFLVIQDRIASFTTFLYMLSITYLYIYIQLYIIYIYMYGLRASDSYAHLVRGLSGTGNKQNTIIKNKTIKNKLTI